jgi:FixJ family two-component response regulator
LRERIRYEAGERFARGEKSALIAQDLRISERSVEHWRRAWCEAGAHAQFPGLRSPPDGVRGLFTLR